MVSAFPAPRWGTCPGCHRPFYVRPDEALPVHAPSDDPRWTYRGAPPCAQGAVEASGG